MCTSSFEYTYIKPLVNDVTKNEGHIKDNIIIYALRGRCKMIFDADKGVIVSKLITNLWILSCNPLLDNIMTVDKLVFYLVF